MKNTAPALLRRRLGAGLVSACVLAVLSACTSVPRQAPTAGETVWQGRLALRVDGIPPQSLAAGFELRGNAGQGELALSSPLGQVLAVADWGPQGARLRQSSGKGSERRYANMDDMTTDLTGTALPVPALFDWLQGVATTPAGWQVDLSEHANGRLLARRLLPLPTAELRLRFNTAP